MKWNFHRIQNGVFSSQEKRIDRSSGECRFRQESASFLKKRNKKLLGQTRGGA